MQTKYVPDVSNANNIILREANPTDTDFAFEMTVAAGRGLIEKLLGCGSKDFAKVVFSKIFTGRPNRFHHKNCVVAEIGGDYAGFLNSYNAGNRIYAGISVLQLLKAGGSKFLWHYLRNPSLAFKAFTLPEGIKGEWYINTIATAEKARGRGVGTLLIKYAFDRLRAEGLTEASLIVEKDNDNAIRLYKKLGFVEDTNKKYRHPMVYRFVANLNVLG